eukprot:m.16737 g.16737  ORF g.16737 m.16737 type:complete len:165 (-) comp7215_c0_seq2:569-1063(-)
MDYSGPPLDPTEKKVRQFMESCGFRAAMATVGGFGMGAMIGMFMSSMELSTPLGLPGMNTPEQQKLFAQRRAMTAKETLQDMYKSMTSRAWSSGKNFAMIGCVFAGTECLIEEHRGKHDKVNPVAAGCLTGGAMGLRGGPTAGIWGCAGFAAFSYAIEVYMHGW